MDWLRVYTDFLTNLFPFLSLNLFLTSFATCKKRSFQIPLRIFFLLIWIAYSIIPSIPYFFLVDALTNLAYVFLMVDNRILKRFLAFIKYEAYALLCLAIVAVLHSFLTWDFGIYDYNETYTHYVNIIGNFLPYIVLSMYIIFKRLSNFPSGRVYKRYFLTITGCIVLMLTICSMILGSNIIDQEDIVPMMFTLLLILSYLCISIYRKVINVLDENTHAKMEIEKSALLKDYYAHVEDNLKSLSILRHDFKNHLIIIQGYADQGRSDKLHDYIQSLHEVLVPAALIDTPSQLITSILNAKNETCRLRNITLHFEQAFDKVNINDFCIVTILSNLLDNAITAAAKCKNGVVTLRISQTGSYLEFDCTNNHVEQIQENNRIFHTTKTKQKEIHGLGITSMRRTVDKLHGKFHIDHTDNNFHVNILLPNYQ